MHPPTVLILGAAGRFGGAAAQAFAQAGWRVLAQVRPGRRTPTHAHPAIEWLPQDLHHHTALQQAAAGATVVVHALNPRRYTDAAWQREVPQLAEHAASLAQALGATLMLPGNVYGYGSQLPAQLSEHTPPQPDHTKARVRVALEQHLKDRAQQGGPRTIVIRAGDFFGAGSGSWLDLVLAKDLQRGKLTLPGPLGVPHAWAYLPDLAQTFVRVAEQRERLPAFATLHFQGHTLTLDDWVAGLQGVAGPLRTQGMPWPLLRALGLVSPTLRSLCGMRYLWQRPHQLDNASLQGLIGTEPHTPWPDALHQALRDLGHEPRLQNAHA